MRRRRPAHFYAFDLLKLDGQDLRNLPLIERKHILRQIIPPPAHVVYVDHMERWGTELFRFVCESDLEGIVAKRRDGAYVSKDARPSGLRPYVQRRTPLGEGEEQELQPGKRQARDVRSLPECCRASHASLTAEELYKN